MGSLFERLSFPKETFPGVDVFNIRHKSWLDSDDAMFPGSLKNEDRLPWERPDFGVRQAQLQLWPCPTLAARSTY